MAPSRTRRPQELSTTPPNRTSLSPRDAEREMGNRTRGRTADTPFQIPRPGWRDIFARTWAEMGPDHVSLSAAGVAFWCMLAIFPAVLATLTIAGLVIDPKTIQDQLSQAANVLPPDAAKLIVNQAKSAASSAGTGISIAAATSILLALWSASAGVKSMMEAMNIAYDEQEKRSLITFNLVAIGLTVLLIVGAILAFASIILAPAILGFLGLSGILSGIITYLRWPVLAVLAAIGIGIIYRYGPSRATPRWSWITPGAILATVLWIVASILFTIYVSNFANYNATYGALGGVIIMLMWMWVSAFVLLMGAELNAEIEHQTAIDTTTGPTKPMGERGAVKADTLGKRP